MANKKCVFVGNIPASVRWFKVKQLFEQFGKVSYVKVLPSKYNDRKQFGFVTFAAEESAEKAVTAGEGGFYMDDRKLKIEPQEDRGSKKDHRWQANDSNSNRNLSKPKPKKEPEPTGPAWIENLNDDCMLYIFNYLSLLDRITCEKVCKSWKILSLQSWSSVKTINMMESHGLLRVERTIIDCVKRTSGALTHLDLGDWFISEDDVCEILRAVTPNLQSISLRNVRHNVFRCNATPKIVDVLAKHCPNLKALNVSCRAGVGDKVLVSLLEKLPKIEELILRHTDISPVSSQHLTNIRKLLIDVDDTDIVIVFDGFIGQAVSNMTLLKDLTVPLAFITTTLNLDSLQRLDLTSSNDSLFDFSGLPNLEELSVESLEMVRGGQGNNLVKHCPRLKKLTLKCSEISLLEPRDELQAHYHKFFTALQTLEHLSFLNISFIPIKLKDEVDILAKFKCLETLIVRESRHFPISERDIVYLINELAGLKHLDISCVPLVFSSEGDEASQLNSSQRDIKSFCSKCISDSERPTLELVIGGCGFKPGDGSMRWRCGRFIINEYHTRDVYGAELSDTDDDSNFSVFDYDDLFVAERFGGWPNVLLDSESDYDDYDDYDFNFYHADVQDDWGLDWA